MKYFRISAQRQPGLGGMPMLSSPTMSQILSPTLDIVFKILFSNPESKESLKALLSWSRRIR